MADIRHRVGIAAPRERVYQGGPGRPGATGLGQRGPAVGERVLASPRG